MSHPNGPGNGQLPVSGAVKKSQKGGILLEKTKLNMEENADYFGVLYPYVKNDDITDIDYNGKTLWLTDCKNIRSQCGSCHVTREFVEQFTKRVSNAVSKPFNKQNPILEAETESLRITIVHESVAVSGRSICIRKSLPYTRMNEKEMIDTQYCSREILALLKRCVREKKNIVFCGEPGVGKTECAKFFAGFIPGNERVITIEDNPEWHYSTMFPNKDCVELRINEQMDYTSAIKTCLRLNPKWMMLSEARSKEVRYLMEGFSTGVKGFTTLHTDDVRKVPDRIINMAGAAGEQSRLENDIYAFIDVAVLIRRKIYPLENGRNEVRRYIDQIGFFYRENQKNRMDMIVEDGVLLKGEFQQSRELQQRDALQQKEYFSRREEFNKKEKVLWENGREKAVLENVYRMPEGATIPLVAEEGGTYSGKKPIIR